MDFSLLCGDEASPFETVLHVHSKEFERWRCRGCAAVRAGAAPGAVVIDERSVSETDLSFIAGTDLGIMSAGLWGSLQAKCDCVDLRVGAVVLGESSRHAGDWVWFFGRHPRILRGATDVGHRFCDVCGRSVYFATGPRYLCPPLIGSAAVHFGMSRLGVPSVVAREVAPKFRGLKVDPLIMRSSPLDDISFMLKEDLS